MDELDHNLLMAWNRVFERCWVDPVEARRRYDRLRAGTCLDRAHRAWCVAVRASDTRIDAGCAGPEAADGVRGLGGGVFGGVDGGSGRPPMASAALGEASCAHAAHEIMLTGSDLQRLGGPVWLDYPGVPIDVAADRLGKHKEALRGWLPVRPGRTKRARAAAGKRCGLDDRLVWGEHPPTGACPLGVRYEPQRTHGRNSGMETPVVWSNGPLDPGAHRGRPPAGWSGSAWMSLAERIPAGFEQAVERVPRFVPYRGAERFRGWWWRCPGRLVSEADAADGIRGLAPGDEGSCGLR